MKGGDEVGPEEYPWETLPKRNRRGHGHQWDTVFRMKYHERWLGQAYVYLGTMVLPTSGPKAPLKKDKRKFTTLGKQAAPKLPSRTTKLGANPLGYRKHGPRISADIHERIKPPPETKAMKVSKEMQEASNRSWKLIERMIESGAHNPDHIAKTMGFSSLSAFTSARALKAVLSQKKRDKVQYLFDPGQAPASAKPADWQEFATAAGMALDQLRTLVGGTPKEILHPAIQRWMDDLEAMRALSMK